MAMTVRQRWLATTHFQPVDHVPDEEFGYWDDTLRRWHAEGLPAWVTDNGKADRYFGFEPRATVPVNVGLTPGFEPYVVEESDTYRISVDGTGVKSITYTDGSSSIPKYLEFPLKDRAAWERDFLQRLDPAQAVRTPDDWGPILQRWDSDTRDIPLGVGIGSLFGWVRNWAGFEGVSLLVYDDPVLVEEIIERLCTLICTVVDSVPAELELDFAAGWEDMCFNHGPIISPAMFEKWMVPRYARITEVVRAKGADIVIVDCDGDISQLVPLWLEGGVNCMFPIEIAAGSDPFEMRRRYGDRVVLKGGVDKRALIAGPEAIDAEIARLAPLVREGGFIPHVDHRVPPDVSFADYRHYLERKRETFGMPHPEPLTEPPAA